MSVCCWRSTFAARIVFLMLTVSAVSGLADPYPPTWSGGTGPAIHFAPVAWPSGASWVPYSRFASDIQDRAVSDGSNGGTSPQNYVNVTSGCTDVTLPSAYFAYDSVNEVLFFRWRLGTEPHTYATGASPGSYSSTDPWRSALWTVMIDIDGDGYREFAVHLNGSSGSPSTPIDVLSSIYSDTQSQSIDYVTDPNIHLLSHNPTAFAQAGQILNFQNALNPTTTWPNGADETVWDYGTTRATKLVTSCTEYFVDYQIPLAMLDATAFGGPKVTPTTPIAFAFATANSLNNPLQKDIVLQGNFVADPTAPVPYGDPIAPTGGTIVQPIVSAISATGCGPATLSATVYDTLTTAGASSVASVQFYAYHDVDGDGSRDDGGTSFQVANGSPVAGQVNRWTATWNSAALLAGSYLLGVRATDTEGNVTWSWLTPAEVTAQAGPTPPNYANPAGIGVVSTTFANGCGLPPPSLGKTATPSEVVAGDPVTFTLTVSNTSSAALTVSSISDDLPPGFTYASTSGGSLAPTGTPSAGASGTITWTFAPATIAPAASGTLIFTAQSTTISGAYVNRARAATSWGTLDSPAAPVSVGSPRLTISKTADVASAAPGSTIQYTITYANDSPAAADSVVITDALPQGITFVSSPAGSYNSGTRTLTWTVGTLGSGEGPYSVTFQASVDNPYPDAAAISLVNTATITSADTAPASASASVFVTAPRPRLLVQKDAPAVSVAPGASTTFTIRYANSGNGTATGVTLTDTIPAGFTFVSATGGGTAAAGVVSWSIPNVAAGATGTVTVTLAASNPYSGARPAVNSVTLDATNADPVTDTYTIGITGCSTTTLYMRSTSTNVGAAGTQKVATDGAAPAGAATVTAPITANPETELARFYMDPPAASTLSFGTITSSAYYDKSGSPQMIPIFKVYAYDPVGGGTTLLGTAVAANITGNATNALVSFSLTPSPATLSAGQRLMFTYSFRADHASQANTVSFRYDGAASPTAVSFCPGAVNTVLDKQAGSAIVSPGGTIAYTLQFGNYGQGALTGATIVDTLPTGTTFSSATLNGSAIVPAISGQQLTFNVNTAGAAAGQLATGASGTLVINANVNATIPAGTVRLTNSATLDTNESSPVVDSALTDVLTPAVSITKSADRSLLVPGDTVRFTLRATNSGYGPATNVTFTDVLPATAYFTYVSGSARLNGTVIVPDPVSGGTLTYNAGGLAAGASATVTVDMQVAASGSPAGLTERTNTASVADAQTPGSRTSDPVVVTISTTPNLRLTKSSTPAATAAAGSTVVYSLTVSNIGSGAALDVELTDVVPSPASFVSGSITVDGSTMSDASDGDAGRFDVAGNRVVVELPSLPGGASRLVQFSVRLPSVLAAGTTALVNTATVAAGNAAPRTATSSLSVTSQPSLTVTKLGPASVAFPLTTLVSSASASNVVQVAAPQRMEIGSIIGIGGVYATVQSVSGDLVTLDVPVTAAAGAAVAPTVQYTIQYANEGTSAATGVVVQDVLPAGLGFVSASPAATSSPAVGSSGTVSWTIGGLAVGAAGSVRLTAAPSAVGTYLNAATADSAETAPVNTNLSTVAGSVVPVKTTSTPSVTNTPTGTSARYTIAVTNQRSTTATGVQVSDVLSSGFTYSSTVSISGGTRTAVSDPTPGSGAPSWGTWDLAAFETLTITFDAAIAPTVGASTHQNELAVTSTNATALTFDFLATTAEDVTLGQADLSLTMVAAPPSPAVSDNVTFTLTLTNGGPSAATGVAVRDVLPAGLTFVSSTPSVGTYDSTTGIWTVGSLPAGSSATLALVATRTSSGAIVNSAEVSASALFDPDSVPGNGDTLEDDFASVTLAATGASAPVLTIAKSGNAASVAAGGQIVYTISYSNTGTAGATNVVITDAIPANTAFVSATGGGTLSGGTVTWTIGAVAAGGSGSVSLTVNVASPLANGTTISNSASIDSDETTPVADGETTTVTSAPILTIAKTGNAASVAAGGQIVYTISYANTGTTGATNVVITDAIPANTTFVSATGGGTLSGGTVTWTIGAVAAGGSGSVSLTVSVASPLANGTTISNSASIDSDETTPVADGETTTVTSAPLLTIAKTASSANVSAGGQIVYLIAYANGGNADATNVIITDAIPANTTFVAASGGGILGGGTVTWTLGTVAAGASGSVSLMVNVASPLANGTTITNSASIDSDQTTPVADGETTTVTSAPILTIAKTAAPGTQAGGQIIYTISYANSGNADASGVLITDLIPANTTFAGATGGGTLAGGTVTWTIGALDAGMSGSVTLTLDVASPLANGTVIDNTATIDSNETGPSSDGTTVTVSSAPVLSVTKSASAATAPAGGQIVYTIGYANSGTTDATGVTIRDVIPPNTSFNGATGGGSFAAGTATWNLGTVPAGTSGSVTLTLDVASPLANGTPILNSASIDSNETAPVSDDETVSITSAPVLSVVKTASAATAEAGTQIVYTIAFANGGSDAATNVVLTDVVPASTTFAAATGGGVLAGNTITWNIGTLAAGASGSVTLTLDVDSPLVNGTAIFNAATLDSDQTGPTSDSEITPVTSSPVLSIVKAAAAPTAPAGGRIVYTISYSNTGNASATNVVVTDVLPDHTSFVAASAGGVEAGGTVTWNLGTIAAGASGSIALTLDVATPLANGTAITNAVSIDSDETAPASDTEITTVTSAPLLSIDKSAAASTVPAGGQVVYTIAWENTGSTVATGVVLMDVIPANTSFSSASGGGTESGGTVTWNLGSVAVGAAGSVTLVLNVATPLANGTTLVNGVTIDSNETGPASDVETVTVTSAPVLTIDKTGPPVARAGGQIVYTIAWTNGGSSAASGVVLADALPANTSFVSASGGGIESGGTVTWNIGNVGAGSGGSVTLTLAVASPLANGTMIVNGATIDSNETAPVSDSASTTVSSLGALSVTKTDILAVDADSSGSPTRGDVLHYSMVVTNVGVAELTSVQLLDSPGVNTTLVAGSVTTSVGTVVRGNGAGDASVTVDLGTLAAGASVSVSFRVTIDPAAPPAVVTVSNQAEVRSSELSPSFSDDPDTGAPGDPTVTPVMLFTPPRPDLAITKVAEGGIHYVGLPFTYTIQVSNVGVVTATNVRMTDPLAASLRLVSATSTLGGCSGTTTVICSIGVLAPGERATITITVVPTLATTVPNTAYASADEVETTMSNNSSIVNVVVSVATGIPTLSTIAMALMMLLLAAVHLILQGRRG